MTFPLFLWCVFTLALSSVVVSSASFQICQVHKVKSVVFQLCSIPSAVSVFTMFIQVE